MYYELNNKFILSRVVIFLESSNTNNIVEWQLDFLYKFNHENTYHEFDNDIPYIEGVISFLDQYIKYPSKVLPHLHDVLVTSSNQKDPLSDVIERIGRLNIDAKPS